MRGLFASDFLKGVDALTLILSFFRRYVAPYWLWFVTGIVCLFGTNWLAVQIPLQLATVIDALRTGNRQGKVVQNAVLLIAFMGACVIVIRTLSRVLFFTPGRLIEFKLKNELFARLVHQQPSFYGRWEAGDIISRSSDDMTFVRVMIGFGLLSVFNTGAALLLTGTQMFLLSWKLSLLVLFPIAIVLVIVQIGIYRFFDLMVKTREQLSSLSEHVLSSIHGIQTIQGFRAEHAFVSRFLERNRDYMNTTLALARIRARILPLLVLGGALCIYILLAVGGPMTARKELSVGELVAFTTYVTYLLMPLRSLGWVMSVFQRGQASLERVMALIHVPIEKPEGDNPEEVPSEEPMSLSLRDLSFSYPDSTEKPVLSNITATIEAGSWVGVFGRTGSGKTTLMRLLTRLYNPPKGTVFVNDIDITSLALDEWREQMAVVPQSPFLFSDTIRSNISMGADDVTDEKLQNILEQAALHGDLDAFPEGLDTVVGERGIMVSGGQRQRITLARALLRPFRFLFLDDVLSAVDHRTERKLIQTLEDISHASKDDVSKPTVLLVSHRLSALANCDQILVLDEGLLVDQGTHEELLERPGPYRDAWLHQSEQPPTAFDVG